jgi:hypothetical protein
VPTLGVTPGAICAAARPVRAGRRAPLAGHPDSLDFWRSFVAANDPSRYFREASAIPAQPVTSYGRPGATEQILYRDESTGTYVRLLRMPPNFQSGEQPLEHDFDEVVYVLEGTWHDLTSGARRAAGTVAVFPAGVPHGPFAYPEGAVFVEVRHYKPKG